MNRRLSQVALSAAAALTLSLAAPVAAQASESGSASLSGSVAEATTKRTPSAITRNPAATPTVTGLRVGSSILNPYGSTTYVRPAVINYNVPDGWSSIPTARLTKSGRAGTISLYDGTSVGIPTAWGAGVYTISGITFSKYDRTAVHTAPNAVNFRVRQPLNPSGALRIIRKGKTLTFKVQKVRSYTGTRWVKVSKVKVQVKKGKKWKTLRNVKTTKAGNRSFKIKHKGKRTYRLYVPTTATVQGAKTGGIRI